MGTTITFDTHAYIKRLKSVGFTEEQAEVQAETFAEIIEERLATKQDLKALELTMKNDLERGLASVKSEIIKWVAGMLVAQAAIVATLVKLL